MYRPLGGQHLHSGRRSMPPVPSRSPLALAGISLAALLERFRLKGKSSGLKPSQLLLSGLHPLHALPDDGLAAMLGLQQHRRRSLQSRIDAMTPQPGHSGRWRKVDAASDSMREAVDMVNLAWYLRPALPLLKSLEIVDDDVHFTTVLKAPGGGILDVEERYPWNGEQVTHPRRDKRRGKHIGSVSHAEDGVSPRISVTWGEPYGGRCSDTFVLSASGDTLTQITDMTVNSGGKRCVYRTVYHRVQR